MVFFQRPTHSICPWCKYVNPYSVDLQSRLEKWTERWDVEDRDDRQIFVRYLYPGYAEGYTSWRMPKPYFYKQIFHGNDQRLANPMTWDGPNPWSYTRQFPSKAVREREERRMRGNLAGAQKEIPPC
jgi:hypothetical protein